VFSGEVPSPGQKTDEERSSEEDVFEHGCVLCGLVDTKKLTATVGHERSENSGLSLLNF
jgi:hypothetical protein